MQRQREHTFRKLILGKQGSGKTTLAKIESWPPEGCNRVLIFNPNDIAGWCCPRSWRIDEIRRRMRSINGYRFAVVPQDAASWPGVVVETCAELFAVEPAETLVIFDEMDTFWPARQPAGAISNVVQLGRNRGISWVGTTRRPAEIHRSITAALTHITTFRMEEPGDLDYLKAYAGGRIAEHAKRLRRYEYISLDTGTQRAYVGCT